MGISIKAALAPEWVTPSTQKDDPAPAQFLLVPLPSTVYLNAHAAFQGGNNGDAALMVCEAAVRDWRGVEIDGDGKFSCTRDSVIDALVDAIEFIPLPTVPRRPRLLGMSGFVPYKSGSKWRLKYLGQDYGISVDRKSDAESFARRQAEASENAIGEWDRKYAWCAGKVEGKDFRYRD